MSFNLEADRTDVILGSRLKAARPLLFILPDLLLKTDDPVQVALAWSLAALMGGAAFLRLLMPGRITLDDRGMRWRTMFSGGRFDWSEVAYAATGSSFRRWSCAYLQLADADGAPAMRRVWIPGFWTLSAADLADRINAARQRVRPNLMGRYAQTMDERADAPAPAPAVALQALSRRVQPAPPTPTPPRVPAKLAPPVFGRRGT